jgi:hypothetical protein
MFIDIYGQILKGLTRTNRRNLCDTAKSILHKGTNYKLTKKELDLIKKIDNFIIRSHFEDDSTWDRNEILILCSKLYEDKTYKLAAQSFVMAATKQSASEKAQLKCMENRGYKMKKMFSSKENSLRFNEKSTSLVKVKIEGVTSRSFDYERNYSHITEYFLGKVVFSQGGHQNGVKSEIVDFLRRGINYHKNNPNSNIIFTALVDGDSLTEKDLKNYEKYTSKKVRLMNSDSYLPFGI